MILGIFGGFLYKFKWTSLVTIQIVDSPIKHAKFYLVKKKKKKENQDFEMPQTLDELWQFSLPFWNYNLCLHMFLTLKFM